MALVTKEELLEAGVHFGHATRRWNPKMQKYILRARQGIYIIDLQKTAVEIEKAHKALFEIAQQGGKVLFVGTKKQAQEAVREEATRSNQFYVDNRWLGGTLTNFKTIRKRIQRLKDLYTMEENGTFEKLPKKEVIKLKLERSKLEKNLGGIKEMTQVPQAIFIVDPRAEQNAILEARKLNIPVFGIVDTNCDPDSVDFVIPANDDAIRAVKLVTRIMANAVVEANGGVAAPIATPTAEQKEARENKFAGKKPFNKDNNFKKPLNKDNNGTKPVKENNEVEAPKEEVKTETTEN